MLQSNFYVVIILSYQNRTYIKIKWSYVNLIAGLLMDLVHSAVGYWPLMIVLLFLVLLEFEHTRSDRLIPCKI